MIIQPHARRRITNNNSPPSFCLSSEFQYRRRRRRRRWWRRRQRRQLNLNLLVQCSGSSNNNRDEQVQVAEYSPSRGSGVNESTANRDTKAHAQMTPPPPHDTLCFSLLTAVRNPTSRNTIPPLSVYRHCLFRPISLPPRPSV